MTPQTLADRLEALEREHLRRRRRVLQGAQGASVLVDGRPLHNFSSNDYLGLAAHPALRAAAHDAIDACGTGAGASALVSGHGALHEAAERRFAEFAAVDAALLFSSGYAANLGVVAALCDRHAEVFGDRLNHACLNDGALLSRARFTRYAHRDVAALEAALARSAATTKLVATDAVFSMDGDVADLPAILALCERHDAWLLVDDAHGVGVLGARGRGTLEHFGLRSPRIILMATLGKALGGYGAFVGAATPVVEWLVQKARTYVFTTALPPAVAASAIAALDLVDQDPGLVARLHAHVRHFRAACARRDVPLMPSETAIQPVPVGSSQRAVAHAARLEDAGFLVPAIRPPTVPDGTARLRVSLSAAHDEATLDALADALQSVLRA